MCASPVEGGWRLVDLASTNGTFLNGEQISAVTITDRMVVHLGNPVRIAVMLGLKSGASGLGAAKPAWVLPEQVSRSRAIDGDDNGRDHRPLAGAGPRGHRGAVR
ncbi:FHA domain-containing protein [Mycobacterium hodleri]|uniref:FHA domain-containing protein n=1 Tax=Mycolicibacterium hodleri TaxID=49897 RepID=UPI003555E457|nr:FHA domain-containing protein [Mycolicibacterium hodleri]